MNPVSLKLSVLSFLLAAAVLPTASAQTLQKTAVLVDSNMNGIFDLDETVQYTLVFTNGTADLADVVIRDESSDCLRLEPTSLTIDPPTDGTDVSSGGAIQVALRSPLAPGDRVTLTFNGVATADGFCCNQATWTSASGGGVSDRVVGDATADQPTCHHTQFTVDPDYEAVVDKQVMTTGCLEPGSVVEFRVFLRNSGRRPLRNAVFEDVLNAGFGEPVVQAGLSWDPVTRRISTAPGTWGVGEEREYVYSATVPCTESGTLSNLAMFTFEDNDGRVSRRWDSESVTWGRPSFLDSDVRWYESPLDGDAIVTEGEIVRFEITLLNSGGCNATGVSVTNQLDPRFLSTAPPLFIDNGGVYDPATGTIEWNQSTTPELATLESGVPLTLAFSTQVDPATRSGDYIPNTVTISAPGGSDACPGLPDVVRTIALQNGSVAYGLVVPPVILLRNDGIACRQTALSTVRTGILSMRPEPQECSEPAAIQASHVQTETVTDPVSPWRFPGDAAFVGGSCPDSGTTSGRVLIFYELQDDCTESLRVIKDPSLRTDVLVSW